MTCTACELSKKLPICGAYSFRCIACCARLVASARPSRAHQEAMLAAIARCHGAPDKPEILAALKAGVKND